MTVISSRMTLDEMRSQVYLLADEEPNSLFKYADVDRLINRGLSLVAKETTILPTPLTTTTQTGLADYSPIDPIVTNAGSLQVSRVFTTVDGVETDLELILAEPTVVDVPAIPTQYRVINDSVRVYPTPDGAYELTVVYVREVSPLVEGTDVSQISRSASEVACTYAVFSLKLKDDELAVADRWKAEFDAQLKGLSKLRTGVYKPVQR